MNGHAMTDSELRSLPAYTRLPFVERLGSWWTLGWLEKMQRVAELYWLLKSQCYYRLFFGRLGRHSKMIEPMRVRNVHNIHVGERVIINKLAFLLTSQEQEEVIPHLSIGDGCIIGHMNHITCIDKVHIGKNVLTADKVYISDHSHGFLDTRLPILAQSKVSRGQVYIGDGTWIGENAVILSSKVGRNCVIGSSAVVITDVPDYSVAVGIPARVVRRFNPITSHWEKVTGPNEKN